MTNPSDVCPEPQDAAQRGAASASKSEASTYEAPNDFMDKDAKMVQEVEFLLESKALDNSILVNKEFSVKTQVDIGPSEIMLPAPSPTPNSIIEKTNLEAKEFMENNDEGIGKEEGVEAHISDPERSILGQVEQQQVLESPLSPNPQISNSKATNSQSKKNHKGSSSGKKKHPFKRS